MGSNSCTYFAAHDPAGVAEPAGWPGPGGGSVTDQSPARFAAVGTKAVVADCDCLDSERWYAANAKSLSWRIGPPKVPPYWFWCSVSFVAEKKFDALM